ncbi:MAG: hypothetical protein LBR07_09630, partial [Puniceicoccales bacterium]|nr:hypothetical protein [Puniceicoccales bacterium]
ITKRGTGTTVFKNTGGFNTNGAVAAGDTHQYGENGGAFATETLVFGGGNPGADGNYGTSDDPRSSGLILEAGTFRLGAGVRLEFTDNARLIFGYSTFTGGGAGGTLDFTEANQIIVPRVDVVTNSKTGVILTHGLAQGTTAAPAFQSIYFDANSNLTLNISHGADDLTFKNEFAVGAVHNSATGALLLIRGYDDPTLVPRSTGNDVFYATSVDTPTNVWFYGYDRNVTTTAAAGVYKLTPVTFLHSTWVATDSTQTWTNANNWKAANGASQGDAFGVPNYFGNVAYLPGKGGAFNITIPTGGVTLGTLSLNISGSAAYGSSVKGDIIFDMGKDGEMAYITYGVAGNAPANTADWSLSGKYTLNNNITISTSTNAAANLLFLGTDAAPLTFVNGTAENSKARSVTYSNAYVRLDKGTGGINTYSGGTTISGSTIYLWHGSVATDATYTFFGTANSLITITGSSTLASDNITTSNPTYRPTVYISNPIKFTANATLSGYGIYFISGNAPLTDQGKTTTYYSSSTRNAVDTGNYNIQFNATNDSSDAGSYRFYSPLTGSGGTLTFHSTINNSESRVYLLGNSSTLNKTIVVDNQEIRPNFWQRANSVLYIGGSATTAKLNPGNGNDNLSGSTPWYPFGIGNNITVKSTVSTLTASYIYIETNAPDGYYSATSTDYSTAAGRTGGYNQDIVYGGGTIHLQPIANTVLIGYGAYAPQYFRGTTIKAEDASGVELTGASGNRAIIRIDSSMYLGGSYISPYVDIFTYSSINGEFASEKASSTNYYNSAGTNSATGGTWNFRHLDINSGASTRTVATSVLKFNFAESVTLNAGTLKLTRANQLVTPILYINGGVLNINGQKQGADADGTGAISRLYINTYGGGIQVGGSGISTPRIDLAYLASANVLISGGSNTTWTAGVTTGNFIRTLAHYDNSRDLGRISFSGYEPGAKWVSAVVGGQTWYYLLPTGSTVAEWDGGAGTNDLWSAGANWLSNTVPGNVAVYFRDLDNNTSTGMGNPQARESIIVDGTKSIAGIYLDSSFAFNLVSRDIAAYPAVTDTTYSAGGTSGLTSPANSYTATGTAAGALSFSNGTIRISGAIKYIATGIVLAGSNKLLVQTAVGNYPVWRANLSGGGTLTINGVGAENLIVMGGNNATFSGNLVWADEMVAITTTANTPYALTPYGTFTISNGSKLSYSNGLSRSQYYQLRPLTNYFSNPTVDYFTWASRGNEANYNYYYVNKLVLTANTDLFLNSWRHDYSNNRTNLYILGPATSGKVTINSTAYQTGAGGTIQLDSGDHRIGIFSATEVFGILGNITGAGTLSRPLEKMNADTGGADGSAVKDASVNTYDKNFLVSAFYNPYGLLGTTMSHGTVALTGNNSGWTGGFSWRGDGDTTGYTAGTYSSTTKTVTYTGSQTTSPGGNGGNLIIGPTNSLGGTTATFQLWGTTSANTITVRQLGLNLATAESSRSVLTLPGMDYNSPEFGALLINKVSVNAAHNATYLGNFYWNGSATVLGYNWSVTRPSSYLSVATTVNGVTLTGGKPASSFIFGASNVISGAGGFPQPAYYQWHLGGNSTFSGGITLKDSNLVIGVDSATAAGTAAPAKGPIGTGKVTLAANGYLWTYSTTDSNILLANEILFSGDQSVPLIYEGAADASYLPDTWSSTAFNTKNTAADLAANIAKTLTLSHNLALRAGGQMSYIQVDNAATLAITGLVTGATGTLVKTGNGILELSAQNTFTPNGTYGGLVVREGTVRGVLTAADDVGNNLVSIFGQIAGTATGAIQVETPSTTVTAATAAKIELTGNYNFTIYGDVFRLNDYGGLIHTTTAAGVGIVLASNSTIRTTEAAVATYPDYINTRNPDDRSGYLQANQITLQNGVSLGVQIRSDKVLVSAGATFTTIRDDILRDAHIYFTGAGAKYSVYNGSTPSKQVIGLLGTTAGASNAGVTLPTATQVSAAGYVTSNPYILFVDNVDIAAGTSLNFWNWDYITDTAGVYTTAHGRNTLIAVRNVAGTLKEGNIIEGIRLWGEGEESAPNSAVSKYTSVVVKKTAIPYGTNDDGTPRYYYELVPYGAALYWHGQNDTGSTPSFTAANWGSSDGLTNNLIPNEKGAKAFIDTYLLDTWLQVPETVSTSVISSDYGRKLTNRRIAIPADTVPDPVNAPERITEYGVTLNYLDVSTGYDFEISTGSTIGTDRGTIQFADQSDSAVAELVLKSEFGNSDITKLRTGSLTISAPIYLPQGALGNPNAVSDKELVVKHGADYAPLASNTTSITAANVEQLKRVAGNLQFNGVIGGTNGLVTIYSYFTNTGADLYEHHTGTFGTSTAAVHGTAKDYPVYDASGALIGTVSTPYASAAAESTYATGYVGFNAANTLTYGIGAFHTDLRLGVYDTNGTPANRADDSAVTVISRNARIILGEGTYLSPTDDTYTRLADATLEISNLEVAGDAHLAPVERLLHPDPDNSAYYGDLSLLNDPLAGPSYTMPFANIIVNYTDPVTGVVNPNASVSLEIGKGGFSVGTPGSGTTIQGVNKSTDKPTFTLYGAGDVVIGSSISIGEIVLNVTNTEISEKGEADARPNTTAKITVGANRNLNISGDNVDYTGTITIGTGSNSTVSGDGVYIANINNSGTVSFTGDDFVIGSATNSTNSGVINLDGTGGTIKGKVENTGSIYINSDVTFATGGEIANGGLIVINAPDIVANISPSTSASSPLGSISVTDKGTAFELTEGAKLNYFETSPAEVTTVSGDGSKVTEVTYFVVNANASANASAKKANLQNIYVGFVWDERYKLDAPDTVFRQPPGNGTFTITKADVAGAIAANGTATNPSTIYLAGSTLQIIPDAKDNITFNQNVISTLDETRIANYLVPSAYDATGKATDTAAASSTLTVITGATPAVTISNDPRPYIPYYYDAVLDKNVPNGAYDPTIVGYESKQLTIYAQLVVAQADVAVKEHALAEAPGNLAAAEAALGTAVWKARDANGNAYATVNPDGSINAAALDQTAATISGVYKDLADAYVAYEAALANAYGDKTDSAVITAKGTLDTAQNAADAAYALYLQRSQEAAAAQPNLDAAIARRDQFETNIQLFTQNAKGHDVFRVEGQGAYGTAETQRTTLKFTGGNTGVNAGAFQGVFEIKNARLFFDGASSTGATPWLKNRDVILEEGALVYVDSSQSSADALKTLTFQDGTGVAVKNDTNAYSNGIYAKKIVVEGTVGISIGDGSNSGAAQKPQSKSFSGAGGSYVLDSATTPSSVLTYAAATVSTGNNIDLVDGKGNSYGSADFDAHIVSDYDTDSSLDPVHPLSHRVANTTAITNATVFYYLNASFEYTKTGSPPAYGLFLTETLHELKIGSANLPAGTSVTVTLASESGKANVNAFVTGRTGSDYSKDVFLLDTGNNSIVFKRTDAEAVASVYNPYEKGTAGSYSDDVTHFYGDAATGAGAKAFSFTGTVQVKGAASNAVDISIDTNYIISAAQVIVDATGTIKSAGKSQTFNNVSGSGTLSVTGSGTELILNNETFTDSAGGPITGTGATTFAGKLEAQKIVKVGPEAITLSGSASKVTDTTKTAVWIKNGGLNITSAGAITAATGSDPVKITVGDQAYVDALVTTTYATLTAANTALGDAADTTAATAYGRYNIANDDYTAKQAVASNISSTLGTSASTTAGTTYGDRYVAVTALGAAAYDTSGVQTPEHLTNASSGAYLSLYQAVQDLAAAYNAFDILSIDLGIDADIDISDPAYDSVAGIATLRTAKLAYCGTLAGIDTNHPAGYTADSPLGKLDAAKAAITAYDAQIAQLTADIATQTDALAAANATAAAANTVLATATSELSAASAAKTLADAAYTNAYKLSNNTQKISIRYTNGISGGTVQNSIYFGTTGASAYLDSANTTYAGHFIKDVAAAPIAAYRSTGSGVSGLSDPTQYAYDVAAGEADYQVAYDDKLASLKTTDASYVSAETTYNTKKTAFTNATDALGTTADTAAGTAYGDVAVAKADYDAALADWEDAGSPSDPTDPLTIAKNAAAAALGTATDTTAATAYGRLKIAKDAVATAETAYKTASGDYVNALTGIEKSAATAAANTITAGNEKSFNLIITGAGNKLTGTLAGEATGVGGGFNVWIQKYAIGTVLDNSVQTTAGTLNGDAVGAFANAVWLIDGSATKTFGATATAADAKSSLTFGGAATVILGGGTLTIDTSAAQIGYVFDSYLGRAADNQGVFAFTGGGAVSTWLSNKLTVQTTAANAELAFTYNGDNYIGTTGNDFTGTVVLKNALVSLVKGSTGGTGGATLTAAQTGTYNTFVFNPVDRDLNNVAGDIFGNTAITSYGDLLDILNAGTSAAPASALRASLELNTGSVLKADYSADAGYAKGFSISGLTFAGGVAQLAFNNLVLSVPQYDADPARSSISNYLAATITVKNVSGGSFVQLTDFTAGGTTSSGGGSGNPADDPHNLVVGTIAFAPSIINSGGTGGLPVVVIASATPVITENGVSRTQTVHLVDANGDAFGGSSGGGSGSNTTPWLEYVGDGTANSNYISGPVYFRFSTPNDPYLSVYEDMAGAIAGYYGLGAQLGVAAITIPGGSSYPVQGPGVIDIEFSEGPVYKEDPLDPSNPKQIPNDGKGDLILIPGTSDPSHPEWDDPDNPGFGTITIVPPPGGNSGPGTIIIPGGTVISGGDDAFGGDDTIIKTGPVPPDIKDDILDPLNPPKPKIDLNGNEDTIKSIDETDGPGLTIDLDGGELTITDPVGGEKGYISGPVIGPGTIEISGGGLGEPPGPILVDDDGDPTTPPVPGTLVTDPNDPTGPKVPGIIKDDVLIPAYNTDTDGDGVPDKYDPNNPPFSGNGGGTISVTIPDTTIPPGNTVPKDVVNEGPGDVDVTVPPGGKRPDGTTNDTGVPETVTVHPGETIPGGSTVVTGTVTVPGETIPGGFVYPPDDGVVTHPGETDSDGDPSNNTGPKVPGL